MGGSESRSVPPRKPVPAGKTRICEAGYTASPHTGRARQIIGYICAKYPSEYESWFYFDAGDKYYAFLKEMFDKVPFPDHLKGHASSPFVWCETGQNEISQLVGGRSDLAVWAKAKFPQDKELLELCAHWHLSDTFHDKPTSAQSTADVKVEEKKTTEAPKYVAKQENKILLLGDKFPTRTQRAAWMLYELGVDFDYEEVGIGEDKGSSSQFLQAHPELKNDPLWKGAVPAIIDNQLILTESAVIVTYLADKFKKLAPAPGTPERLRYDQLVMFFNTEIEAPAYSTFLHSFILPTEAQVPQVLPFEKERWTQGLHQFESLLKQNGSGFLFGSSFSALDVICGYWICNLNRFSSMTETFPLTAKYAEAMAARPAFGAAVQRLGSFL
jgi:glutathione S-transferase